MKLNFEQRKQIIVMIFAGTIIFFGLVFFNIYLVGLGLIGIFVPLLIPKHNFRMKIWGIEIEVFNKKS